MSLYDGLDIDDKKGDQKEKKPDVSGWGSNLKMLETQKQLQAKKASLVNVKKKQGPTMAPVIDLKRRNPSGEEVPLHFNQLTGRLERMDGLPMTGTPFIASEAPTSLLGVADEYDPYRPNDYETVVKRKREQKQKERELERQKEIEERERKRRDRHGNISDEEGGGSDDEFERRLKRRREEEEEELNQERNETQKKFSQAKAAIAPPTSLIQEDSVANEVQPPSPPAEPIVFRPFGDPPSLPGASFGLAGTVASKIMARMGYRDGQGLGKDKQGMSQALQVEKTSKRGGKIIHEKDIPKGPEPPRAEVSNANLLRNPSKVMLLRNMVGPGEVDEELEGETSEECTKYGKVVKCMIFEIPTAPEVEAVRIFVEFERMESTIKAVVDLNGRFFGGRVVKASFYNLDKFRRLDLGSEND